MEKLVVSRETGFHYPIKFKDQSVNFVDIKESLKGKKIMRPLRFDIIFKDTVPKFKNNSYSAKPEFYRDNLSLINKFK